MTQLKENIHTLIEHIEEQLKTINEEVEDKNEEEQSDIRDMLQNFYKELGEFV